MAKRRRLSPPQESYLAGAAPETKAMPGPFGAPPIARVAHDSALSASVREMTETLRGIREEGRLIQRLPLAAIEADHLVRDRIAGDDEEMAALSASLKARGQQTPIEVVELAPGRYGLISGRRRLQALSTLHQETGEDRFASIEARLRAPQTAGEAYVAMVEENEIRVGLGHYERARIAVKTVEQGVYPDVQTALRELFASASRAKRSKIGSFVTICQRLGGALRFPAAIPERLGLALAQRLEAEPGFAAKLAERLDKADPADAAREQAVLTRALAGKGRAGQGAAPDPAGERFGDGIRLEASARGPLRLTLSGPAVDAAFAERLRAWLRAEDVSRAKHKSASR